MTGPRGKDGGQPAGPQHAETLPTTTTATTAAAVRLAQALELLLQHRSGRVAGQDEEGARRALAGLERGVEGACCRRETLLAACSLER